MTPRLQGQANTCAGGGVRAGSGAPCWHATGAQNATVGTHLHRAPLNVQGEPFHCDASPGVLAEQLPSRLQLTPTTQPSATHHQRLPCDLSWVAGRTGCTLVSLRRGGRLVLACPSRPSGLRCPRSSRTRIRPIAPRGILREVKFRTRNDSCPVFLQPRTQRQSCDARKAPHALPSDARAGTLSYDRWP